MKILVSDHLEESCFAILRGEGFDVDDRAGISAAELAGIIGAYDALIVRSATQVTAELLAHAGRLRVIGRAGTGVDNIDLPAATRRGILVMNAPGGNTVSAAEHTVSLMLALARNIPQAQMSLAAGAWERKKFIGTEVFEKTIGVIGLGKIGREVAARCMGLGMKVIGYDPVLAPEVAARASIALVSLEEIYRRADFITVHTPLTPETRGLLNDTTLARCKRGVRLINCARGGIIDEQALLRALDSGHVAGAALDVFTEEPPRDNPLVRHPRVVSTPHLGASTEEAQEKVAVQIAASVADALLGRGYAGLVNGAVMERTMQPEARPFMVLAEKMGSALVQLAGGTVRRVTVHFSGDVVEALADLLKTGILKGLLSYVLPEPVNFINAPILAEEMGIQVGEVRGAGETDYQELVTVTCATDTEEHSVSGTVFGGSGVRFVGLEGFRCEVRPEGFILLYRNIDRPGMLARVAGVLAEQGVNIAAVSLGRGAAGGEAMTVMNIDGEVSTSSLRLLASQEGVQGVRQVRCN